MEDVNVRDDGYFPGVREVCRRLSEFYEDTNLGNKEDPFDELVYVVLSARTRETFYQKAFERVQQLVGDWRNLLHVPDEDLKAAIGEAGLSSRKTQVLKNAAKRIDEKTGEVSLDFLRDADTGAAERFLIRLHGVGRKTAKCVLMYALDRPVFPVDTHCRRVMNRLGWIDIEDRRMTKSQEEAIEEAVPPQFRKQLHIRLVQHGRSVCVRQTPKCGECPVSVRCSYYKEQCD
jgi:endonuclease III